MLPLKPDPTAHERGRADLFGRGLSLSFGPGVGSITVPRLNLPNADFVREREAVPVSESQASAAMLSPHKVKIIVMATWELLRNPAAEDMLRQMMIESVGPALDAMVRSMPAESARLGRAIDRGTLSAPTPIRTCASRSTAIPISGAREPTPPSGSLRGPGAAQISAPASPRDASA